MRNFLMSQGYDVGPIARYQDDTSCMVLVEGRTSGAERTRHICIRYFWVRERVERREAVLRNKGTKVCTPTHLLSYSSERSSYTSGNA